MNWSMYTADRGTQLRIVVVGLAAALLILLGLPGLVPQARAQAVSPTAIADYQAKLAQYQAARGVYDAEADAYWDAVASKRRVRNAKRREHRSIDLDDYVLTQPPIY